MQELAEKRLPRRVYARELREKLGIGETWLKRLEETGRIPRGRTDPGGNRKFWLDDEAEAIVRGEYGAAG
jgi:hypothetical protein